MYNAIWKTQRNWMNQTIFYIIKMGPPLRDYLNYEIFSTKKGTDRLKKRWRALFWCRHSAQHEIRAYLILTGKDHDKFLNSIKHCVCVHSFNQRSKIRAKNLRPFVLIHVLSSTHFSNTLKKFWKVEGLFWVNFSTKWLYTVFPRKEARLIFQLCHFEGTKLTKFTIFLHDNLHEKSFWLLISL